MCPAKSLSLLLLLALSGGLPAADDKKPVPGAAALAEAEKLVKDVFRDEYARTDAADKLALAKKLLGQAQETKDDPAARYVLFREAIDLAAQAGDLTQALRAANELAAEFALPDASLKAAAVEKAGPGVAAGEARDIAERLLFDVAEAVAADDFAAAERIAKGAEAVARKSRHLATFSRVLRRAEELSKQKGEFQKVQAARATLKATPDDAGANAIVGRHTCLAKGDWDAGLPLLARSGDGPLKALAQKDLALPTSPADQLVVADGWYDLAAKDGPAVSAQLRARYWYKEAVPGLTGLSRARAEKRVAELDRVAATHADRTGMFAAIRKLVADKKVKKWDTVGGAFGPDLFEDVPPDGAFLIGFRYTTNGGGRYPGMVQPIWQTAHGPVFGKEYGTPEAGAKAEVTRAKPGYAVGAIYTRGGGGFDALKPIYMRLTDRGVNSADKYDGPLIGGNGGGEGTFGGDGSLIVGIHGRKGGPANQIFAVSPVTLTQSPRGKG